MKKKLLLAISLVALLACLFAITSNAQEIDASYLEQMTSGMLTVELEDGTVCNLYDEEGKALTWYLDADNKLTSVRAEDLVYGFNGTSLSSISLADGTVLARDAHKGKAVVVNLRGLKNSSGEDITNFYSDNMFKEDSPLQHIFMPDSIEHIVTYAFGFRDANKSHLIGCYFSNNSQLKTVSENMFLNCNKLKYFNMPTGVTTIGSAAFSNCASLGEMYIPNGVTQLGYNNNSNTSPFNACTNMYFVNTPGESKPDVYYIPSSVTTIVGEIFKSCQNLNDVIVFSEKITSLENGWAFYNTNNVKVVFLGDMVKVSTTGNAWNKGVTIYFCNENDKSAADLTGLGGNPQKVFCHAEGNTTHLAEKVVDIEASCEVDAGKVTYCFCGCEMSKEAVEGTALSHDYDYIKNDKATLVGITYSNYSQNGIKTVICANCGVEAEIDAPALFICLGYSGKEFTSAGIAVGFTVNNEAVSEYTRLTGKTVSFGVFAVAQSKLGESNVFDAEGNAIDGSVTADLTAYAYATFEVKVTGFADDQKDLDLAMGAYVKTTKDGVTEHSYMQATDKGVQGENSNYYFVSYNDIVE